MLDTLGPELLISNRTGNPVELKADSHVTISPDVTKEPTAELLPVNYAGLAEVCSARFINFVIHFWN